MFQSMGLRFRSLLLAFFLCYISIASVSGQTPMRIDGAYRFVSETTVLTKSKAVKGKRTPPEWSGMFFFVDGYFNVSLVDNTRQDDWLSKFPENINEVGYETFAGKYRIDGDTLALVPELKLHPWYDRYSKSYKFKVDGDTLTLTETIRPFTEDLSEGKRVIVLTKLKAQ